MSEVIPVPKKVRQYPSSTVFICTMLVIILVMQAYLVWKEAT